VRDNQQAVNVSVFDNPRGKKKTPHTLEWWRNAAFCLSVLLGAGGGTAGIVAAAPANQLEAKIEKTESVVSSQQKKLDEIASKIDGLVDSNNMQIAREEAHRLTDNMPDDKRSREYDRILARNLSRLSNGKEPCGDLACY
jgi:hypothetical protein